MAQYCAIRPLAANRSMPAAATKFLYTLAPPITTPPRIVLSSSRGPVVRGSRACRRSAAKPR